MGTGASINQSSADRLIKDTGLSKPKLEVLLRTYRQLLREQEDSGEILSTATFSNSPQLMALHPAAPILIGFLDAEDTGLITFEDFAKCAALFDSEKDSASTTENAFLMLVGDAGVVRAGEVGQVHEHTLHRLVTSILGPATPIAHRNALVAATLQAAATNVKGVAPAKGKNVGGGLTKAEFDACFSRADVHSKMSLPFF